MPLQRRIQTFRYAVGGGGGGGAVWYKNTEGGGPPGPLPWIRHCCKHMLVVGFKTSNVIYVTLNYLLFLIIKLPRSRYSAYSASILLELMCLQTNCLFLRHRPEGSLERTLYRYYWSPAKLSLSFKVNSQLKPLCWLGIETILTESNWLEVCIDLTSLRPVPHQSYHYDPVFMSNQFP